MKTPKPRGALSSMLFDAMRGNRRLSSLHEIIPDSNADAQIALWALYEQHYRGFDDVEAGLEWDPHLLAVRAGLEASFETLLRERFVAPKRTAPFAEAFFEYVSDYEAPSLAKHVQSRADRNQVLQMLKARSIYQLKEADPTIWAVPCLPGGPAVALMALQFDEYGAGNPRRQHAQIFARGMEACELDATYGAYINEVSAEVLAQNNAMSLFGLNRRWRGAAVGHLAAFEADSSLPSQQMVRGLRRIGLPDEIAAYYVEHIEADAVHEQLPVREICEPLVRAEPELLDQVFLGAFTCVDLEARTDRTLLGQWAA